MWFIASSNTALLCCLIIEVSKSFSRVSDWQWGRIAPLLLPDFLVRDDMTVVSFPSPSRRNTAVGSATLSRFICLFGAAAFEHGGSGERASRGKVRGVDAPTSSLFSPVPEPASCVNGFSLWCTSARFIDTTVQKFGVKDSFLHSTLSSSFYWNALGTLECPKNQWGSCCLECLSKCDFSEVECFKIASKNASISPKWNIITLSCVC